jgi:hypothetical protein
MGVEVKDFQMSLAEIDRAILLEAAGCSYDDKMAHTYDNLSYQECVLMLPALARKILGLTDVRIGNNPERAQRLGYSMDPQDYEAKHAAVDAMPISAAEKKNRHEILEEEKKSVDKVMQDYDPEAWGHLNRLTRILTRRAMALERAGFVEANIDTIVADAAEQRDRELGGDGAVPMEGSVVIKQKGLHAIGSQRWPMVKKVQKAGTHRFDYDVEMGG